MAFPPSLADRVVRAVGWDDGGAEFVYADNTILSFVDEMNTYVAVRGGPSPQSDRITSSYQHHHHRHASCFSTSFEAGIADDTVDEVLEARDAGEDRELCFTAWTLSTDTAKVRGALHIFNSLSPRPRLLSSLLPTDSPVDRPSSSLSIRADASASCGVWTEPGPPIETLLLEKRADLFQRHRVLGTVEEWMIAPHDAPRDADASWQPFDHYAIRALPQDTKSPPPQLEVPVGTVLELWCALRRVRLTVAVHRETFTVRWPAPVTHPSGSRLPSSFAAVPGNVSAAFLTASLHPLRIGPGSQTVASAPFLYTYVEQTFPVSDPPGCWQPMLKLVLELDAELLRPADGPAPTSGLRSSTAQDQQRCGLKISREAPEGHDQPSSYRVWEGRLPEPQRWGGELNGGLTADRCRFSSLTTSQATHIVAPKTARALETMRSLHPAGTRLRWLYEAVSSGTDPQHPPAIYWCVHDSSQPRGMEKSADGGDGGSVAPPGSRGGSLSGMDVLTWVAEDGSVLTTRIEGSGYTVTHHRLGKAEGGSRRSRPIVFRIRADGEAGPTVAGQLPPRVTPLRCCHSMAVGDGEAARRGQRAPMDGQNTMTTTSPPCSMPEELSGVDARECPQSEASPTGTAATRNSSVAVIDPLSLRCPLDQRDGDDGKRLKAGAAPGDGYLGKGLTPAAVCDVLASLTAESSSSLMTAELLPSTHIPPHSFSAVGSHAFPTPTTVSHLQHHGAVAAVAHTNARSLRHGRYLASVADVSVQLLQLNLAAQRAVSAAGPLKDEAAISADGWGAAGLASTFVAPRRAAYCEPVNPTGGDGLMCGDSALSETTITYLTSRLDGIGTFTALTNGVIRVQFDDRTLLTLVPGADEFDEAQLIATGVLRHAARFTVRVAQCREGHELYRYVAYALPFRHFVYWQAAQMRPVPPPLSAGHLVTECGDVDSDRMGLSPRNVFPLHGTTRKEGSLVAAMCGTWSKNFAVASVASLKESPPSAVTASSQRQSRTSPTPNGGGEDTEEDVNTVEQRVPVDTTAPLREWHMHPGSHESPAAKLPHPQVVLMDAKNPTEASGSSDGGGGAAWGLTDMALSIQAVEERDLAEAREHQTRLEHLLAVNTALSDATRALLRS